MLRESKDLSQDSLVEGLLDLEPMFFLLYICVPPFKSFLQVFRMELHHLIHPWKSVSYQEFLVLEKVLVSVLLLNPEMSEISDS